MTGVEATRQALLDAHIVGCSSCQAFAAAHRMVVEVLPTLAEIDPGDAFTAAVLHRTTGRERRAVRNGWRVWPRAGEPWWSRVWPRSGEPWWIRVWLRSGEPWWIRVWPRAGEPLWSRVWLRPRIGLEAAYVSTALCVVLVGNPLSLVSSVAGRVQTLAEATSSVVASTADRLQRDPILRARAANVAALAEATSSIVASTADRLQRDPTLRARAANVTALAGSACVEVAAHRAAATAWMRQWWDQSVALGTAFAEWVTGTLEDAQRLVKRMRGPMTGPVAVSTPSTSSGPAASVAKPSE